MHDFFRFELCRYGEVSEGSVEQSNVDSFSLLEYRVNMSCPLSQLDASHLQSVQQITGRRYEKVFNHTEVSWLFNVYQKLYLPTEVLHVPMIHQCFDEVVVLGERFLS